MVSPPPRAEGLLPSRRGLRARIGAAAQCRIGGGGLPERVGAAGLASHLLPISGACLPACLPAALSCLLPASYKLPFVYLAWFSLRQLCMGCLSV